MEETLVARAAEFKREVALLEDKGSVDEGVERFEEFPLFATFFLNLLVGVAGEAPNVPVQFVATEVGNFFAGFGLEKGLTAAESDASLSLKLAETVFNFFDVNFEAAVKIPSLGILTAFAVGEATLRPEDRAEAVAVNN